MDADDPDLATVGCVFSQTRRAAIVIGAGLAALLAALLAGMVVGLIAAVERRRPW